MAKQHIYRVQFYNRGDIYELYARDVNPGAMYAFVELEDIIFGEKTDLVVDPGEEKLKSEFEGVKRTYIPMNAVIRIDEVSKQGTNKIIASGETNNVTPFPVPARTPE